MPVPIILTLNSGSSSLKTSVYSMDEPERLLLAGELEGIGREQSRFRLADGSGGVIVDETSPLADHASALRRLFDVLRSQVLGGPIGAVGHRIVHGGPKFNSPRIIVPELLDEVRKLVPFSPLHLPAEIAAVEATARLLPAVPQVACFDTSFHTTLPEVARVFPLPRRFVEQGIHRYGFHGLSYEYVMEELRRLDPASARGKVVVAHLGSGASMAAIDAGRCIDTTMGFSPVGGLVMATRTGDLDPGVLLYLLIGLKIPVADLLRLLNQESGLLGLSGRSADMRELLGQQDDPASKLAVDVFCRQAGKFVASLAASLSGLDALVFTAGIGERSAEVRARICAPLGFLGIALNEEANEANAPVISSGRVVVRVLPTNEELMIARHAGRLV